VNRCRWMTICLLFLCATGATAYQISGKDLLRRGLRGNKAYSVSVVLTGPTQALGLSSSQVGEQIRARLRQARISIDAESDGGLHFPKLHFQLDAAGPTPEGWYAITIRSAVQDNLVTVPRRGYEIFLGDSYSASRIVLANGEQSIRQEVRLQVDELLDQFINDHLEMNSQDQTRPTPK